jgi:hypothetical protein
MPWRREEVGQICWKLKKTFDFKGKVSKVEAEEAKGRLQEESCSKHTSKKREVEKLVSSDGTIKNETEKIYKLPESP